MVLWKFETVTSYTLTKNIPCERCQNLLDAKIVFCAEVHCVGQTTSVICVDPATGLACLWQDSILHRYRIELHIWCTKNKKKHPVAEHALEERTWPGYSSRESRKRSHITHVVDYFQSTWTLELEQMDYHRVNYGDNVTKLYLLDKFHRDRCSLLSRKTVSPKEGQA